MINRGSCITKLVCTNCGKQFNADEKQNFCVSCGRVLYPRYDLEKAKEILTKHAMQMRKMFNS